ncbi:lactonase, 7-bladed beta-propeller domain-containing protein [Hirsutella rhossiliensis]|uniref:Lactonase, 7-bladed beta-propeller domain-containing protein n=1 Tax=Hirsutella rhossiliensis TaxID=111463 RepID=A0A9P8N0A9_9HYPO|nr:lactonase, 7-bladed beta-propeller domain-containing protein [Hirsutella rhossiliensis]KAH0965798.1 lactonase, 7-bladed beta-propeller domain-containing protein [Hirsutella rhossiliensis]
MPGSFRQPSVVVEKLCKGTVAHAAVGGSFLYVSSYCGKLTTLDVSPLHSWRAGGGNAAPVRLKTVSSTNAGGNPSFLTIDKARSTLFCLDEGLESLTGALASFKMKPDGSLALLDKKPTPKRPVFGALYNHGKCLGVAHYGDEAMTTWNVWDPHNMSVMQTEKYKPGTTGSGVAPQDAPRPHQVLFDPTGQFAVVPDLGSDQVRIYRVPGGGKPKLRRSGVARVETGSGPRHAAFAVARGKTYMYLLTELSNQIIGFKVHYRFGLMNLQKMFTTGIHGKRPTPEGAFASEIAVTPDNKSVIVSSRNENSVEMARADGIKVQADPLIHFSINSGNGHLTVGEEVSCGGSGPRQFCINKAGTLLAVALQTEGRVAVMGRDLDAAGLALTPVGIADVGGEVTSVVFDE